MQFRKGLVLGVLLALAVAGCGGQDNDDGIATAGGGTGSGTASASPTASPMTDQERAVKFAQCMRDQGIDMQDPDIDGGKIGIRVNGGGADKQKMEAATEKCRQYLPNGGDGPNLNSEQVEQFRKMAQCMREHGLPDFPDPEPDGGIRLHAGGGSHLDPDDPTFKAAQEACAQYQPDGRSLGGAGTSKEQK